MMMIIIMIIIIIIIIITPIILLKLDKTRCYEQTPKPRKKRQKVNSLNYIISHGKGAQ